MKIKFLITAFLSLALLISTKSQVNTNPPHHSKDSLEILAFNRLAKYIEADSQSLKKWEESHVSGERHILVVPIQTYPGSGAGMENHHFSYDNFLPTVYHKEETQGSPFLLPAYVPGLVVNQLDTIVYKPDYLYNYDKMSGNFLLKRDNDPPIAVNKDQVKMFCLKLNKGGFIFERVALINSEEYFQVIYKGPKYSVYKLYKSKFVSANQKTTGYISEGNNYDEYRDIYTYYLLDERKEESVIFEISKKSIRKSFAAEAPVVEEYIKDHKTADIDESFVAGLAAKINQ